MTEIQTLSPLLVSRPEPHHQLGEVQDDWHAAELWLADIRAKRRTASRQTELTYRQHLAKVRFYCEHVAGITLSRWTKTDALKFVDFMADVPQKYLSLKGAKQGQPGWSPFRKTPSDSSAADIQRCIHSLFISWREDGYVRFCPLPSPKGYVRNTNIKRSISIDLFDMIIQSLHEEVTTTHFERMQNCRDEFIFTALRGLGLRASELVCAKMSAFRLFTIIETGKTYWIFNVDAKTAKGGIERNLPVTKAVLEALERYRRCFGMEGLPNKKDAEIPLILSPKTVPVFIGKNAVKSTRDRQFFSAWSTVTSRQAIYTIVKNRLAIIAKELKAKGDILAGELEHVSPHWLRHTFAKAVLNGGQNMREVAGHLGHSSMDTAMRYTEQDTRSLIEAWERSQPNLLATISSF